MIVFLHLLSYHNMVESGDLCFIEIIEWVILANRANYTVIFTNTNLHPSNKLLKLKDIWYLMFK